MGSLRVTLLPFILLILGGIHGIFCGTCNPNDLEALINFKAGIRADTSGRVDKWIGQDCCSWDGISCDNKTGKVTQINLPGSFTQGGGPTLTFMTGFLAPSISLLSTLEVLDLGGLSNLKGQIPPVIGNLSKLRKLYLYGNQLDGPIPDSIGMLSCLEELYLNENHLYGFIPPSLGNLIHLKEMYLFSNRLSGPIPDSVINLKKLEILGLQDNFLTGKIPENLGDMKALKDLDLSKNSLNGKIPFSITKLSSVVSINLEENRLEGEISFPSKPGELQSLGFLRLSHNHLAGSIPSSFGYLASLQRVFLDNNHLQGPIPSSIGDLKKLTDLYLDRNQLSGALPQTLGGLSQLQTLNVAYNKIQGILPDSMASLKDLQLLDISFNSFNFTSIPALITDLPSLFKLYMAGCGIQGEIPESLQKLSSNIDELDISSNKFTGPVPDWIGKFTRLYSLNLSLNSFSSQIPSTFKQIEDIGVLDLHSNNFSGPVNWIFEMPASFDRGVLSYIDVSDNKFSGGIQQIGIGIQLGIEYLNFSHNSLNGSIPSSIGNLQKMVTLDLSNNQLNSNLPALLANATDLEHLKLQENRFSGKIPDEYLKLQNLKEFNVSRNLLEGKIPEGKPLVDFPSSSYSENSGLCGKPLEACNSSNKHKL